MADPHQLDRFLDAQRHTYDDALAELRHGRKASHWMWWVFPQLAGLGRSSTARHYGITSADEGRAYLAHPVLGPRLIQAMAVVGSASGTAEAIMGAIDAMKLRSSATLFATIADDSAPFRAVLDRFYAGADDPSTVALLRSPARP